MFSSIFLFSVASTAIAQDEAVPASQDTVDGTAQEAETEAPEAADASTINVRLTLNSGVVLQGRVAAADLLAWSPGSPLSFTPEDAEAVLVSGDKIASIEQVTESNTATTSSDVPVVVEPDIPAYTSPGGFGFPNPAASRYLYAPSSIPMEKGQGYIAQRYAVFSSVAYGVTDNVTVLFGTLTPFPPALVIGGLKVAGKVGDKLHIGVAGEVFSIPLDTTIVAAVAAGSVTYGTKDNHVTVSSGVLGGEISNDNITIPLVISGHKRLSDRLGLLTENWVVFDPSGGFPQLMINSVVVRVLGRQVSPDRGGTFFHTDKGYPKNSWDFGLLSFYADSDILVPVPYIDYAWHFGS
jgi:hypothetical protein